MKRRFIRAMSGRLYALYRRQRGLCFYCSKPMMGAERRPTIDHKIPVWAGGAEEDSNRVAACDPCNFLKGPLDAETFIALRGDPARLAGARFHAEISARGEARRRRPSFETPPFGGSSG